MEKIRLEKLEELPDAEHPGNIKVGFLRVGLIPREPEVGECFWLLTEQKAPSFRTSTVTEIIDKDTFRTVNSIYRIERDIKTYQQFRDPDEDPMLYPD